MPTAKQFAPGMLLISCRRGDEDSAGQNRIVRVAGLRDEGVIVTKYDPISSKTIVDTLPFSAVNLLSDQPGGPLKPEAMGNVLSAILSCAEALLEGMGNHTAEQKSKTDLIRCAREIRCLAQAAISLG